MTNRTAMPLQDRALRPRPDDEVRQAATAGRLAQAAGQPRKSNPYPAGSVGRTAWDSGWRAAREDSR